MSDIRAIKEAVLAFNALAPEVQQVITWASRALMPAWRRYGEICTSSGTSYDAAEKASPGAYDEAETACDEAVYVANYLYVIFSALQRLRGEITVDARAIESARAFVADLSVEPANGCAAIFSEVTTRLADVISALEPIALKLEGFAESEDVDVLTALQADTELGIAAAESRRNVDVLLSQCLLLKYQLINLSDGVVL